MTDITICVNCANLIFEDGAKTIWSYLCKAFPLVEGINPVTGEKGYRQLNDLGNNYFSTIGYDHCVRHNKGDCKRFFRRD